MKYSKDFKRDISNLFLNGLSVEKICQEYNFPHAKTIYRFLHEFGIDTPSRKLSLDEDFFETINTEEKAYWLGFISADGYVSNNNRVWIGLSKKDWKHLEKFKLNINSSHKIGFINLFDKRTNKIHEKVYISFYSKKMMEDLNKLGLATNKSFNLKAVDFKIEEELQRHYWRGLVDGDGSIYKTGGRYYTSLAGTFNICNSYLEFLKSNTSIENGYVYERKNIFEVRFNGNLNTYKIVNFLYNNSTIFLDRKKEIVDKLKTEDVSFISRKRYSNELKNEIFQKLKKGCSVSEISKEYNINKSTVNVWNWSLKNPNKETDINFI